MIFAFCTREKTPVTEKKHQSREKKHQCYYYFLPVGKKHQSPTTPVTHESKSTMHNTKKLVGYWEKVGLRTQAQELFPKHH